MANRCVSQLGDNLWEMWRREVNIRFIVHAPGDSRKFLLFLFCEDYWYWRHCDTVSLRSHSLAKFYLPSCAFEDEYFVIQLDSRRAINLIELALIEVDHSAADLNLYCECRFSVRGGGGGEISLFVYNT